MPAVACPHCGKIFDPLPAELSDLSACAQRILTRLPQRARTGWPVGVRELVESTGYSPGSVSNAVSELCQAGYFEAIKIGKSGTRHRYRAKAEVLKLLPG